MWLIQPPVPSMLRPGDRVPCSHFQMSLGGSYLSSCLPSPMVMRLRWNLHKNGRCYLLEYFPVLHSLLLWLSCTAKWPNIWSQHVICAWVWSLCLRARSICSLLLIPRPKPNRVCQIRSYSNLHLINLTTSQHAAITACRRGRDCSFHRDNSFALTTSSLPLMI